VKHKISLPRGQILGAYCAITLANGEIQYELMEVDEINVIKSCSRGSSSPQSPWNKFFSEMAKKSVFRRATKWLKLSPDVLEAIAADDEASFDFGRGGGRGQSAEQTVLFPREKTAGEIGYVTPITGETLTVAETKFAKENATAKEVNRNGLPF
jgi:hypothetical protein